MALRPWDLFMADARLNLPKCPDLIITHNLRRAAIDLCERSRGLQVRPAPFATAAGTAVYAIDPGEDAEIVSVEGCVIDGAPIDPTTMDLIDGIPMAFSVQGKPSLFMKESGSQIRLWKTPDGAYVAEPKVAVKPTEDAVGIDEAFAAANVETIVYGALAQLLVIANQPWTNPESGLYYGAEYERGVASAIAARLKAGTRTPIRTVRIGRV